MNHLATTLVLALMVPASSLAETPEKLVRENCTSCHGSEYYTRADRIVTSRPGLTKQVRRCELALGLTWFDDEIESVTGYLNRNYYHFPR